MQTIGAVFTCAESEWRFIKERYGRTINKREPIRPLSLLGRPRTKWNGTRPVDENATINWADRIEKDDPPNGSVKMLETRNMGAKFRQIVCEFCEKRKGGKTNSNPVRIVSYYY